MGSGYYTDKLPRRKAVAMLAYLVTAFGTAAIELATTGWHVLLARSTAWLGRGLRTPARKALLAAAVTRETYGRAFGFRSKPSTAIGKTSASPGPRRCVEPWQPSCATDEVGRPTQDEGGLPQSVPSSNLMNASLATPSDCARSAD
jgi:hypothetical protein